MRHAIDADRRPGRFLILGSASKELIRQSSETLAGRIRYLELTPFDIGTGAFSGCGRVQIIICGETSAGILDSPKGSEY